MLPASLVIINDIFAYLFGFFFGRTPLIKISPKKTWEGFLGALVTTVYVSFHLSRFLAGSKWLVCPRTDLTVRTWCVIVGGAPASVCSPAAKPRASLSLSRPLQESMQCMRPSPEPAASP